MKNSDLSKEAQEWSQKGFSDTIVRETEAFNKWISERQIENISSFSRVSLFEIYVNSICFGEIAQDKEIPVGELIVRM